MGALAGTLLPAAVGLALLGLAGPLERRFGAATANATAARAALVVAVLAILLLWQSLRRGLLEHRAEWLRVGYTTTVDWQVQLDGLALLFAAVALLALVLGVVADLAAGTAGGARPGARIALACGGALVLVSGGTLAQLGLGVGLVVLALRAWPKEHGFEGMSERTWLLKLVALGLGVAGLAWLASAGDLDLARLERAALGQERSELVRGRIGGPFGELAPGLLAAVGAGAAALAWALAWPRLVARAWASGPAPALVAAAVGLPAVGLVLLRTHLALALAPTTLALFTLLSAGVAAWAGIQAARGRTTATAVTASAQVTLAIALATAGIGDGVAAARLLAVAGLASAAMTASLTGPRRARAGVAAVAAVGLVPALGAAIAGLWGDLSAWSPGVNAAALALALVGVAGLAAGGRRVVSDRTEAPGWSRPEAPSLLLGVAATLALATATAGVWPLAEHLWPEFVVGRMLTGPYALGPRGGAVIFGAEIGAGLVALALALGVAAAGKIRPAPASERAPRAGADGPTIPRLLRLGERLVGRLTLWPGDERVAVAPGRFDVRAPLLLAAAGTLAILGSVICNPDVLVLGPTRVHPVDLGGLDAAMVGARRGASEEEPAITRPPSLQPDDGGQGGGVGPAPLGVSAAEGGPARADLAEGSGGEAESEPGSESAGARGEPGPGGASGAAPGSEPGGAAGSERRPDGASGAAAGSESGGAAGSQPGRAGASGATAGSESGGATGSEPGPEGASGAAAGSDAGGAAGGEPGPGGASGAAAEIGPGLKGMSEGEGPDGQVRQGMREGTGDPGEGGPR